LHQNIFFVGRSLNKYFKINDLGGRKNFGNSFNLPSGYSKRGSSKIINESCNGWLQQK
jgi:hypothetical protein